MPKHSSRFECPSAPLELGRLAQKARGALWMGLTLATVIHLSLTRWSATAKEHKAVQPLTTQFIKRAPRLTKPLEMKKRPRPRRRMMQRKMVSVEARAERKGLSSLAVTPHMLGKLARPDAPVHRAATIAYASSEPKALAASIQGTMQPEASVDMSLEMVDIEALDTGQYQAMIIQDPSDRRGVRGFFHFYRAYPASAVRDPVSTGNTYQLYQNDAIRGLNKVMDAVNRYTSIRSDVKGSIHFDSRELLKTPWIYHLGVSNFEFTPSEAVNLAKYMQVGGLFFADTIYGGANTLGDASNRGMIRQALGSVGVEYERDWAFENRPNRHTLYHCFFDFASAPAGGFAPYHWYMIPWVDFLEGVIIDGRVLAIVSKHWYAKTWGGWGPGTPWPDQDNQRQLEFGVNIVVFALTQEGSITNQVMDAVQ